jgi:hypothetical protein
LNLNPEQTDVGFDQESELCAEWCGEGDSREESEELWMGRGRCADHGAQ